jgi:hypothetical protein
MHAVPQASPAASDKKASLDVSSHMITFGDHLSGSALAPRHINKAGTSQPCTGWVQPSVTAPLFSRPAWGASDTSENDSGSLAGAPPVQAHRSDAALADSVRLCPVLSFAACLNALTKCDIHLANRAAVC